MIHYRGWKRPNGRSDVVRFVGREESWLQREKGRSHILKVPWDWGESSPGALELAYALLRDMGLSPCASAWWQHQLMADITAHLNADHWALTRDELYMWLVDQLCVIAAEAEEELLRDAVRRATGKGGCDHERN